MKPRLLRIDSTGESARLYVSGLSTVEALRLLPPDAGIAVTHMFGEMGYGKSDKYVSHADLPSPAKVEDVVSFIRADDELALIGFIARIDGGVALSTHDDAEAQFELAGLEEAAKLLEAATATELSAAHRAAVLANRNRYVLIAKDTISVFETFDDVLASGALAEG